MQKNGQNDPKDRKASLKASLFLKSFLGGFAINNADELADREDSRKHGTSLRNMKVTLSHTTRDISNGDLVSNYWDCIK